MSADAILTTGCSFIRLVNITNDDGTAYDLTGVTDVLGAIVAPAPYEATGSINMSVVDAANGIAQIALSAMTTAGMPAPAWLELEVRVVDGSDTHPVGKYTIRTEPGRIS